MIGLLLLVLFMFEFYLALPPGIPFVTSFGLIPIRARLANYAMIALVAYALYAFGFTVADSLGIALIWMTLAVYLVFDYFYDLPLAF
ncbi:MAG: hypothetical protein ACR2RA_01505 [Geminicoccaceae bacterium]